MRKSPGRAGSAAAIFVAAMLIAGLAASGDAEAQKLVEGVDPSIGKVEVTLELPKDKPYVGEMIMLRMRSFVRAFIVLDEIHQPPLINFDWQQLGRDKPIQAMIDGFSVAGVERDIAIFPQQAGRLVVEPFVRHVTIVTDDNRRVPMDFASKTVFVDVQNHTAVGAPDAWWLPAKSLTLTDTWSTAPDEIKPGTLARRTVTIDAVGLTADRLPPAPTMLAPGTIAFKGPAERQTTITEDGPVAHATYQWDIRPVSASPAQLAPIHISWFDTTSRRLRDAALPGLWVAYTGTLVHTSHEKARTWAQTYLAAGPVLTGVVGFGWSLALAGLLFLRPRSRRPASQRYLLRALRRAGRFRDETAFRATLLDLARDDPKLWAIVSREPLVRDRLAALDRSRFAREGGAPPPLGPLGADICRLMEEAGARHMPSRTGIPALDGPVGVSSDAGWSARLRAAFARR